MRDGLLHESESIRLGEFARFDRSLIIGSPLPNARTELTANFMSRAS